MESVETNQTLEADEQTVALPTWETIAGGVVANRDPKFLPRAERLALCLAVEEYEKNHISDEEVFKAIGLNREKYYAWIWLTPDQRAEYEKKRKIEEEKLKKSSVTEASPKRKKRLSREEIIARLNEIGRMRYVEGMFLEPACRANGMSVNRYHVLLDRYRQRLHNHQSQSQESPVRKNGVKRERTKGKVGRPKFVEVQPETLELRKEIVDKVHMDVMEGTELRVAARNHGIYASTYHLWVRQIEIAKKSEEVENPLELLTLYRSNRDESVRNRFIALFEPYTRILATRYADRAKRKTGMDFDEDELFSIGLFEGVTLNMDVYDESRGTPIQSFFFQKIAQRMLDAVRKMDWIPRQERQKQRAYYEFQDEFILQKHRPPLNLEEFDSFLHEQAQEAHVDHIPYFFSYDAPAKSLENAPDTSFSTLMPDGESAETKHDARVHELVEYLLGKVHGDIREILSLYYVEGLTLKNVGATLGISESRASQIHAQGIRAIKGSLPGNTEMPRMMQK